MDVRKRKVRVTFFYLVLIGVLILATSFYVYNQIQRHLIGTRSPFEVMLDSLSFGGSDRMRGVRVAVLRSQQTAEYLASFAKDANAAGKVKNEYFGLADFWQSNLQNYQIDVELINDEDLTTSLGRYNLLILPMVHCLSTEQAEAVKQFLAKQHGVIMTQMTGNRDENGREQGWSLLADVTGGRPSLAQQGGDSAAPLQFNFVSETPITASIPPGARISVMGYDQPVSLSLREARTRASGIWQQKFLPADNKPRDNAAVAYGSYLGGRFAWIGFSTRSLTGDRETWDTFDRVLRNAVEWTAFHSVAGKAAWPNTRAAALFGIQAEQEVARGRLLQEEFTARDIRPAFFVDPQILSINRYSLEQTLPHVELGAHVQVPVTQLKEGLDTAFDQRLQQIHNEFATQLNSQITGFTLPEKPQKNTGDTFTRIGFEWVWVENQLRSTPVIPLIPHQPLFRRLRAPVYIFQSVNSDRQLLETENFHDPQQLLRQLQREYNFATDLGGLYTITLHSDLIGSDAYLAIVPPFLDAVRKRDDVWFTTPDEVATWWRQYDNVRVRVADGTERITLIVTNEGRQEIPEIRVQVYPPRPMTDVTIRAERIYAPIPQHSVHTRDNRIDLVFRNLGARENLTYYIDFKR